MILTELELNSYIFNLETQIEDSFNKRAANQIVTNDIVFTENFHCDNALLKTSIMTNVIMFCWMKSMPLNLSTMGPNISKMMQVLPTMKLVITGCSEDVILLGENMNHRSFTCAKWWQQTSADIWCTLKRSGTQRINWNADNPQQVEDGGKSPWNVFLRNSSVARY